MDADLTSYEIAVEDGHCPVTTPPSGTWTLCTNLTDIGFYDLTAEVEWEFRGDRVCIDGIELCTIDGNVFLDPIHGNSLQKELYARLAAIALSQREDILDAYRNAA
jgi:hypothetical protein